MSNFRDEIELRWVLRDIRAQRFMFITCSPEEMQHLVDTGLVEMVDDKPSLTKAGLVKLDTPTIDPSRFVSDVS